MPLRHSPTPARLKLVLGQLDAREAQSTQLAGLLNRFRKQTTRRLQDAEAAAAGVAPLPSAGDASPDGAHRGHDLLPAPCCCCCCCCCRRPPWQVALHRLRVPSDGRGVGGCSWVPAGEPAFDILEREESKPFSESELREELPKERLYRSMAQFMQQRHVADGYGGLAVSLSGGVDSMVVAYLMVRSEQHTAHSVAVIELTAVRCGAVGRVGAGR